MTEQDIMNVLKAALWNPFPVSVDQELYDELNQHTIIPLSAPALSQAILSEDIQKQYKAAVLRHICYYHKYIYEQENLPLSVPYVILKGTAASQYYPYPEYRTMGDIDVITRREDFEKAYQEFLSNGYKIIKVLEREVGFEKDGIIIELHHFFASLNDPLKAQYMDDLIISNITSSHVLPDRINGLVLLEHISQHLENGLGLRQIIDWMMFVDKCLPDEKWLDFQTLVDNIGLRKLAIIVTKTCEIYLGLTERKWCNTADKELCRQLMDYVLSCGNFGSKKTSERDITENVFAIAKTPKAAFELFQKRGLANWKAAQRYPILRHFAWIYQAGRYFLRGIRQSGGSIQLREGYGAAKRKNALLDALEIKRASKGVVVYRDGKYVKR